MSNFENQRGSFSEPRKTNRLKTQPQSPRARSDSPPGARRGSDSGRGTSWGRGSSARPGAWAGAGGGGGGFRLDTPPAAGGVPVGAGPAGTSSRSARGRRPLERSSSARPRPGFYAWCRLCVWSLGLTCGAGFTSGTPNLCLVAGFASPGQELCLCPWVKFVVGVLRLLLGTTSASRGSGCQWGWLSRFRRSADVCAL